MATSVIQAKSGVARDTAAKARSERTKAVPVAGARRHPTGKMGCVVTYHPGKGVGDFIAQVSRASPLAIVEIERQGVPSAFLKDLSRSMEIPAGRMFTIVGLPKATAMRKVSSGGVISGSSGQAALGMAKLIAKAQDIVANSTAKEAQGFDAAKWLGRWIERPQPSLGGRAPADLMDTPTGLEIVSKLLGAAESGAYL